MPACDLPPEKLDTFTRLSPAIDVRQRFPGSDVVDTLERVAREVGCPKTIRVDNGPEFVSKELDLWAFLCGVTLDFSRPGKPADNAFIESLNGKFRAECLNANRFLSLDEARRKCEAWHRANEMRPNSAIGNQVPGWPPDEAADLGRPVVQGRGEAQSTARLNSHLDESPGQCHNVHKIFKLTVKVFRVEAVHTRGSSGCGAVRELEAPDGI